MHPALISSRSHLCRLRYHHYHFQLRVQGHRRQPTLLEPRHYAWQDRLWRLCNLFMVYFYHNDLNRLWIVFPHHHDGATLSFHHIYLWSCHQLLHCCGPLVIPQNENWGNSLSYYSWAVEWIEEAVWRVCGSVGRDHFSDSTPFIEQAGPYDSETHEAGVWRP